MSKYMGQIMAECDCRHSACEMRGYCMVGRIEEMEAALDSAEIEHGMTSNGNLWRFWSKRACDTAKQNSALEAKLARLREALEVFADDKNWFDATEDNIRYPAWRGPLDEPEEFARAALAEKETPMPH